MTAANEHTPNLLEELAGKLCRCGGVKASKQTFCRFCYFKLPKAFRSALYKRVGEGYEEAYDAAVKVLEAEDQE